MLLDSPSNKLTCSASSSMWLVHLNYLLTFLFVFLSNEVQRRRIDSFTSDIEMGWLLWTLMMSYGIYLLRSRCRCVGGIDNRKKEEIEQSDWWWNALHIGFLVILIGLAWCHPVAKYLLKNEEFQFISTHRLGSVKEFLNVLHTVMIDRPMTQLYDLVRDRITQ